jgi:hypothetical protein|tara:strand:+ start:1134 stop:1352 length:219 start_codon:yes stop_codon:yes gene_type:complete
MARFAANVTMQRFLAALAVLALAAVGVQGARARSFGRLCARRALDRGAIARRVASPRARRVARFERKKEREN